MLHQFFPNGGRGDESESIERTKRSVDEVLRCKNPSTNFDLFSFFFFFPPSSLSRKRFNRSDPIRTNERVTPNAGGELGERHSLPKGTYADPKTRSVHRWCLGLCLNRRAPSNIRLEMHKSISRNQTYVPRRVEYLKEWREAYGTWNSVTRLRMRQSWWNKGNGTEEEETEKRKERERES